MEWKSDLSLYAIPVIGISIAVWIYVRFMRKIALKEKEYKRIAAEQEDYIRQNGITVTRDLKYNGPTERCRVIVDDDAKVIYVSARASRNKLLPIPYDEVLNLNVSEKSFRSMNLGGAIIIGLASRRHHAYIGPADGTNYVTSYAAILGRKNMKHPTFEFRFFDHERMERSSVHYRNAASFVQELRSIINVIHCAPFM